MQRYRQSLDVVLDFRAGHVFEFGDDWPDGQFDLFVAVVYVVDQERHQVVDEEEVPVLDLVDEFVHKRENSLLLPGYFMSQQQQNLLYHTKLL